MAETFLYCAEEIKLGENSRLNYLIGMESAWK